MTTTAETVTHTPETATTGKNREWRAKTRLDYRIMHVILALGLRFFFFVFARTKVIGLKNVPRTGPVILAANHASYVDPPLGWAILWGYRRAWGIARDDLWNSRAIAYLLDSIGVVPVKRNSPDRAMLRAALRLLNEGQAIGIFPEGTRSEDGNLLPGMPGVAMLAQRSGAPICPAALIGTFEMLPRGAKRLRIVPLKVIIGEPRTFTKETPRDEIVDWVMDEVARLLTENGRPSTPAPRA